MTNEEIRKAKARISDGTKSVEVERHPYRPKLESTYMEPETEPDKGEGLELLYKQGGKMLYKTKTKLPPRDPDDIIKFDEALHKEE